MKNFNPKVSIIIPVYNGSNYLREAIDSALAQTYKKTEVIVVNDGSDDGGKTEKIAKSYGSKIRYYKKDNGGVATALNLGIEKMTGEYFSWLSHDDIYLPEKIEAQINYLEEIQQRDVVIFCDYKIINEKSKETGQIRFDGSLFEDKPEYILLRGCVNGITLLIPKKIIDSIGLFDTGLMCTQDYDYWRRVNKKYKFVHMGKMLTKTRVHSQQGTANNPKVEVEGDNLWISMMDDVSDYRKRCLEGSKYGYYFEMSKHLKHSCYKKARKYAEEKAETSYMEVTQSVPENERMISVVIPCYNQGRFINQSISSILRQTYGVFEIIIINDGSTDKYTNKFLSLYSEPHTRVFTTSNQGLAKTRNYGVSLSRGQYIQFLDADDMIDRDKFKKQICSMLEDDLLGVCYSDYRLFKKNIRETTDKQIASTLTDPLNDFIYKWQRGLCIPIHCAIFRKSIWRGDDPFEPRFCACEDWLMWVNLAYRKVKFKKIDGCFAYYRKWTGSMTSNYEYMLYWATRAISFIADNYVKDKQLKEFNTEQTRYIKYLCSVYYQGDATNEAVVEINKKYDALEEEYKRLAKRQRNDNEAIVQLLERSKQDNQAIVELIERDRKNNEIINNLLGSKLLKIVQLLRLSNRVIRKPKKRKNDA